MVNTMERVKNLMNFVLSYVTAFLLIIMTSLVLWQVFTRYILNDPSTFTEELVRIILVWTSFLGAAYAFGTRQHMSLIFLKEGLKGKKKILVSVVIDTLILIFAVFILIKGGYNLVSSTIAIKTPILQISKGLVYSVGPITGIFILFYQMINLYEDFKN